MPTVATVKAVAAETSARREFRVTIAIQSTYAVTIESKIRADDNVWARYRSQALGAYLALTLTS